MKINAIYLPDKRTDELLTDKRSFTATVVCLCVAVISAVVLYIFFYRDINESLAEVFLNNFNNIKEGSKPVDFSDLLLPYLVVYAIVILSATSIFGDQIIIAISCLRISGISILLCFIYYNFGLTGLEFAFLILLPGKLLYVLSLLVCIKSGKICTNRIRNKLRDNHSFNKEIIAGLVLSFVMMIASVVVDFCMFRLFSGLFSFNLS